MKRVLRGITAALVVLLLIGYWYREPLKQAGYDLITRNMFVTRDDDAFDPGPAVGSRFPGVTATWRGREVRRLEDFAGPAGTLFVAARSVAWCPFCMRQLIQLQEHRAAFDAAGIGLVAMTYDDPAAQRAFVDNWGIAYPILHDVDTLSFRTLGILNPDYQPGDVAYGIPWPGMLIIDPHGVVVGKLFLEGYSKRVDALSALAFAREVLGLSAGAAQAPQSRATPAG